MLSYRIAKKLVKHKGENTFLGKSNGIHCGVRDYFHDILYGVRRKDGRRILAPPVTELPEIFPSGQQVREERRQEKNSISDEMDGEVADQGIAGQEAVG